MSSEGYNLVGDLYNGIREAFVAGNAARTRVLQQASINLITALCGVPAGMDGVKNGLNVMTVQRGLDVGDARLPSVPMNNGATKALHASLQSWCEKDGAEYSLCASN